MMNTTKQAVTYPASVQPNSGAKNPRDCYEVIGDVEGRLALLINLFLNEDAAAVLKGQPLGVVAILQDIQSDVEVVSRHLYSKDVEGFLASQEPLDTCTNLVS